MSIDKRAAERRRFARVLGTAEHGVGLPVGPSTDESDGDS